MNRNAIAPVTNTTSVSILEPSYSDIIIHNMQCSVDIGCRLDLNTLNYRLRYSEYNPKRFPAAILRLHTPKVTALTFSSGKMVVSGAKHESSAALAVRKFGRIFEKLGYKVELKDFRINNILATYRLKFPVDLEKLNKEHSQFSRYEPEIFPALIYRLVRPRVVMLVYINGNIVIVGSKTRKDLRDALDAMFGTFKTFRKQ